MKNFYDQVGLDFENFQRVTVTNGDMEKFANMIVQECISIVAKRKDQAIADDCNVDEAMSVAEMDLLEHFGVEL